MRIKLILDPWAGGGKGRRYLPRIVKALGRGNLLDVLLTKGGPPEADLIAREVDQKGYDMVVAGGGDGMVNGVINGVLRIGKDLPLGIIPLGMSNTAACGLGLPLNTLKACEIILQRKIKRIDLGKTTKPTLRYFLSILDYGFLASIVNNAEVNVNMRFYFGRLLYWIYAYMNLFKHKFSRILVKIDRNIHECHTAIVCNSGYIWGKRKIAPQAKIDDGFLDVCILKKSTILDIHRYGYLGFLFNKLHSLPDVEFYRAQKISITSSEKVACEMDGQPFGFTSGGDVEVAPKVLPVIVP